MVFNKSLLEEIQQQQQEMFSLMQKKLQTIETSMAQRDKDLKSIEGSANRVVEQLELWQKSFEATFKNVVDSAESVVPVLDDLRRSVRSFDIERQKIIDNTYSTVKSSVERQDKELAKVTEAYSSHLVDYSAVVEKLDMVSQELTKFKDIAKEIKTADFELSSYAKSLRQADHEKLQLMRKIESMERLVSGRRKERSRTMYGMPAAR